MAEEEKRYEVGGIQFTDAKRAEHAKRELEGIAYIKEQNDLSDSRTALALYNKLMEKNILKTEVGKVFLEELKQQLILNQEVDNAQIYGYDPLEEQKKKEDAWALKQEKREREERAKPKENVYKYRFYNSLILNIILIAAIIFILIITTNSKNINILNFEDRLIKRYSTLDAYLTEREQKLNEREKILNEREQALEGNPTE